VELPLEPGVTTMDTTAFRQKAKKRIEEDLLF
jgi:hypothetical protein